MILAGNNRHDFPLLSVLSLPNAVNQFDGLSRLHCCTASFHTGSAYKSPARQVLLHTLKLQLHFLSSSTSNQPCMRFLHHCCYPSSWTRIFMLHSYAVTWL
jgi:hypothetical protein